MGGCEKGGGRDRETVNNREAHSQPDCLHTQPSAAVPPP